MCGIAGIIRKSGLGKLIEDVSRMNESQKHRGPDDGGIWQFENICIGHRRLAIIDLEEGKQPFASEDSNYVLTYNGELYNYIEIREDLIKLGHIFKTASDTEVVLRAYIQWGKKCVERFRGMFAFAIVDKVNRVVFLARDHFGIKPLVYYCDENVFAFASEIQAIKCIPELDLSYDLKAIDSYLLLQYIPAPMTAYRNIRKLQPASMIEISFDNRIISSETYWSARFEVNRNYLFEEWIERVEDVLYNSVNAHMISDVKYGALLSGGIDSSLVATVMSALSKKQLDTFTISFLNDNDDESKYAKYVADKIKSNHHVQTVAPNTIELVPELVKHYGEPFADSSAIPCYYVSKMAKKEVKMVLSGDGADELFAGYKSYENWDMYLKGDYSCLAKSIIRKLYRRIRKRNPAVSAEQWTSFIQYESPELKDRMWRDEFKYVSQPTAELFVKTFKEHSGYEAVQLAQIMDINSYLPYDILTKVDITSMMNSIEVRTPFVDRKVFDLALSMPISVNFDSDIWASTSRCGKKVLKHILLKKYDKTMVFRRKKGFSIPGNEWLMNKDTKMYIEEHLIGEKSALSNYFNIEIVRDILEEGNFGLIYQLLFLNEWLIQN